MNGRWRGILVVLVPVIMAGGGCLRIKPEPVEVKPIHITLDINVKVDRELDSFFNDIDAKAKQTRPAEAANQSK